MNCPSNPNRHIADYQLALLADELAASGPYLGYPEHTERLVTPVSQLDKTVDGRLVIPEGPWTINSHPDNPYTEVTPQPEVQTALKAQGYELDALGRPLHPWLSRMLGSAAVGAVFGKGYFWGWGKQPTADAVITLNNHLLLVRRRDTGQLALPGGFIDPGEDPLSAARREVTEETGFVIPAEAVSRARYRGLVVDMRMTGNAWPESSVTHFDLGTALRFPEVSGRDDAAEALWMPRHAALRSRLFGAHPFLIRDTLGIPLS